MPGRHRDGRRGVSQRRAACCDSDSMFAAHELQVGTRLSAPPATVSSQRAGDLLPRARAAARRAASPTRALAHAAGRRAATCASSARCCSAARPASRPGRPPSARGEPVRLERRRRARGRGAARSARASTPTASACSRSWRGCAPLDGRAVERGRGRSWTGRRARTAAELALARRRHGSPPRAASCRCPTWRAGGRTRTASRPCTTCACWSAERPRRRSSTRVASAFASSHSGRAAITTSSATGSTCTSTACACSHAARFGRRSTRSAMAPVGRRAARGRSCRRARRA